jgi:hypothetical protein
MVGLYRAAAPGVTMLDSAGPTLVFAEFCEAMGGAIESRFTGRVRAIRPIAGYSRWREEEDLTNNRRPDIIAYLPEFCEWVSR